MAPAADLPPEIPLSKTDEFERSLKALDLELQQKPNESGLWSNRGVILVELERWQEAEQSFLRAVALNPEDWISYYSLGRILVMRRTRYADAVVFLRRAADIQPHFAQTYLVMGRALQEFGRYDEACAAYDESFRLDPTNAETLLNKGGTLHYAHRMAEAEALLRKVIEMAPDNANAHYNLSALLLTKGDLEEGFREYEWRWRSTGWPPMRHAGKPLWDGTKLNGQTLLLYHDQGLGDSMLFIRLISKLARENCQILVEIQPELYRICIQSFHLPNVRWFRSGELLQEFDLQVPLLTLAHILRISEEVLLPFKPYLQASESDIAVWQSKLSAMIAEEKKSKLRVGIVWAGNPLHTNDHYRSISARTLEPLLSAHADHIQFVSLQKGQPPLGFGAIELDAMLDDFATTAAVLPNLDLIIAVDTSIVHLAGAMGIPIWLMCPHTPDWRWILNSETSPWYPSLRIFWQHEPGNWSRVISEVNHALSDATLAIEN